MKTLQQRETRINRQHATMKWTSEDRRLRETLWRKEYLTSIPKAGDTTHSVKGWRTGGWEEYGSVRGQGCVSTTLRMERA